MRATTLSLLMISLVTLSLPSAAESLSAKEMMEFGVEAAKRGLWREAAFRWERSLLQIPDNARLRNNLAVAYESLGELDRAAAEYKEALRLEPDNKEIRDNYDSFLEIHRAHLDKADRGDAASHHGGGS